MELQIIKGWCIFLFCFFLKKHIGFINCSKISGRSLLAKLKALWRFPKVSFMSDNKDQVSGAGKLISVQSWLCYLVFII